jgi:hypothetical protein
MVNDYARGITLIASLLLVEPWGRVVHSINPGISPAGY